MVPIRKGAFIKKVKDITISSALSLAVLSTGFIQGCGGSNPEEQEIVFTKGIETHIQETEKGVFKITEERVVPEDQTKAIVQFLNGGTDTLTVEQAKRIIDADNDNWDNNESTASNNSNHSGYYGGGLSNVLFYGGMGYFLGRSMNSQPVSSYYANPGVYNRAQQNSTVVQSSRVSRPVSSSKGFFRSGSRTSGGA